MGIKRKGYLFLISSIFFIFLSVILWNMIQFHRNSQDFPLHSLIGNKSSTATALKEKGLPFSFLVIGDTHDSHRATTLIKRALKEGDPSFMIILGDFVSRPDIRYHHYYLKQMAEEIKLPLPIFLVPGNHDIDYASSTVKEEAHRVTPKVYESLYGPRNFYFIFNNCLFVISGIDPRDPPYYLNYLRETLSQQGKGKKHIFIFIHNPPKLVGPAGSFSLPNEEEFFSLLYSYKVTTCFFGDTHAYGRGQSRGTNLIVSGGGGRLKQRQSEWGKFNHIMKITVDENMIREGMMILKGEEGRFRAIFKKWVFIHLFPILKNSGWMFYLVFAILLTLSGFFCFKFLKTIRSRCNSGETKLR